MYNKNSNAGINYEFINKIYGNINGNIINAGGIRDAQHVGQYLGKGAKKDTL